ncbi:helix-turn-helix domain-containing protein [Lactiplantibacillus nangangensis]|uniref:Helix-turn-helix domain-containing protein n=1 Tax=Lactiplantibacillus nangangensis TaxID=2559917 RepID=A0ABW1SIN5_9LACO|nr:helix-turn-helix transcriptional regulator [Lactiplantibacillus nangangensis]
MTDGLGVTIKQLRLAKGLTQAAVYSGIVSRSFASRFESGHHDISASKLFEVLDNLAVSVDEFRFIHQHYQPSPLDQALSQANRYYEAQNFPALSQWIKSHAKSPRAYDRLVASYMQIKLLSFDRAQFAMTAAVRPAVQHLQQTPMWTLQELKFANVLVPLSMHDEGLTGVTALMTKMVLNCQRYCTPWGDPFRVLGELLAFYGTVFQVLLSGQAFDQARQLRPKLLAIAPAELDWDGRLTQQVWLALWECYFGDWQAGQDTLSEIMAIEKQQRPFLDNNLRSIIQVRTAEAQRYRKR